MSNDFCEYPAPALSFEYLTSVFSTVLLEFRICTLSVSKTPEPSAVSTCSQKVRLADEVPAGMVTSWYRVSLCVLPFPPIHASHEPEWGGSAGLELIML